MSLGGYDCQHCYQLLGVDVILDTHLHPYVIEVSSDHSVGNKYTLLKYSVSVNSQLVVLFTPKCVYRLLCPASNNPQTAVVVLHIRVMSGVLISVMHDSVMKSAFDVHLNNEEVNPRIQG